MAGETIDSTFRHPYFVVRGEDLEGRPALAHLAIVTDDATTPGRWVDSGDLRVGDELLLLDGRIERVEHVRLYPSYDKVYNFEVEELHSYAVGRAGVLVHNGNGKGNIVDAAPTKAEGVGDPRFATQTVDASPAGGFVDPKQLNVTAATQNAVKTPKLEGMKAALRDPATATAFWDKTIADIASGRTSKIDIVEFEGTRYIADGTHRFLAALEEGVNIPKEAIQIRQMPREMLNWTKYKLEELIRR